MDKCDIAIIVGEARQESGDTINQKFQNTAINPVDSDIETCNEYSQDLFNDNESFQENSPCINFDVSGIVRSNTPPLDIFATPTQSLRIHIGNRSPSHPSVPAVPTSLMPFISTVNESWTSDLETPHAETAVNTHLLHGDKNVQQQFCGPVDKRDGCGFVMSMGKEISNVTTPNGCFTARDEGNEGLSISPILRTVRKRRRPKRRILDAKDASIVSCTSSSQDNDVVESNHSSCHTVCGGETKNFVFSNNYSISDRGTFGIDDNCSLHNTNIRQELPANKELQGCEEITENNVDHTLKNEEEIVKCSQTVDKFGYETSLVERMKEIKALQRKKRKVRECKYVDIPTDAFTRDAVALENAEMLRVTSSANSTAKKQWGLISFTEMCAREEDESRIGNSETDRQTWDKTGDDVHASITDHKISDHLRTDKTFAPSIEDRNDVEAIGHDEFSPWFYQSDEPKPQSSDSANIRKNMSTANSGEKQRNNTHKQAINSSSSFISASSKLFTTSRDNVKGNMTEHQVELDTEDREIYSTKGLSHKENNTTNSVQSYRLTGSFSTASGKPIVVSEDKIRKAAALYDEIAMQDGYHYDDKIIHGLRAGGDHRKNSKGNEVYRSASFSACTGNPVEISEGKLRGTATLYEKVSSLTPKQSNNVLLPYDAHKLSTSRGIKRSHEYSDTGFNEIRETNASANFTTASGKPIAVSETAIKRAKLMYESEGISDNQLALNNEISKNPSISKGSRSSTSDIEKKHDAHNECADNFSVGFMTASGKPLAVSEIAMNEAKRMYESEATLENQLPLSDRISKNPSSSKDIGNGTSNIEKDCGAQNIRTAGFSVGFMTASGKALAVSETAIKRAKMIYESEDNIKDQLSLDDITTKYPTSPASIQKCKTDVDKQRICITAGTSTCSISSANTSAVDVGAKASSIIKARNISINSDTHELQERTSEFGIGSSISVGKQLASTNNKLKESDLLETSVLNNVENLPGFCTAAGKPLEVSEKALQKAKKIYDGLCDIAEYKDAANDTVDVGRKSLSPTKSHSMRRAEYNQISKNFIPQKRSPENTHSVVPKSIICTGFNTASGKAINISDQALTNAKILLEVEENTHVSNNDKAISSSAANTNCIKMSEFTLGKARNLSVTEQENTPPRNLPLNGSSNTMEISDNNISVSNTTAYDSVKERIISDNTPLAASGFQPSKRVRFNSYLQTHKSFGEKDYVDNKTPQTPVNAGTDRSKNLTSSEHNGNDSFIRNNMAGMYATSDMFQLNDRVTNPKLEPQKSWPSHQDVDTSNLSEISLRSVQTQKDRQLSAISEEITASTEALLADEENSNDAKSWASAITCSPTLTEDRHISVKPVTLDADSTVIQVVPTSPVIGSKFRLRRRIRQSKKNTIKKDVMNVHPNSIPNGVCGMNDHPKSQNLPQDAQPSRCDSTATSDLFEGVPKNTSPVIEQGLTSTVEKCQETSQSPPFDDKQSENQIEPVLSEVDVDEVINDVLENRITATLEQEKQIRIKKKYKPKPANGSLLLQKITNRDQRVSWHEFTNGISPTPRSSSELRKLGIELDVMDITAANALCYKFKCSNFYSKDKIQANVFGLEIADGAKLISDENGYAGVLEFRQAFLASPGVDPALVPYRWVENHYRWIVWKLAAMDRVKFGDLCMRRMLTPDYVMAQLKYRYDREIDKAQRPALRRIIEKDDPACRRMVLCVACISKLTSSEVQENNLIPTSYTKVELTDGWYGITATIDAAMAHMIACGKVREGTKLVTCRAELLNCDQGYSPLEIPGDVSLKIHSNSTRRARWDTKLGYCKYGSPISTALSAVLSNGGLIGKLKTNIARVYPVQYFEKKANGQSIFRNNRAEDKAAMLYERDRQALIENIYAQAREDFETKGNNVDPDSIQVGSSGERQLSFDGHSEASEIAFQKDVEYKLRTSLPPPRKVTLLLRVRLMEGQNIAILSVWAPSEDIIDVLKEGNCVSIHNVQMAGRRCGELHLTAGHQSFVKHECSNISSIPRRCLTSIPEVAVLGFNPIFSEFDTVGIVISLGSAPHGMRNFEAVNLAYPNPDASGSAYLSILFWEGIEAYGFSDILAVGSTVACTNLQWRRGVPRTIPLAYAMEYSTFTRNPRQAHLRSAFDSIKDQVTDTTAYVSHCAAEIDQEHQKKPTAFRSSVTVVTPSGESPSSYVSGLSPRTPQNPSGFTTPAKYSINRRLEKLQWYGEPPELSPITPNQSSTKVRQKFIPLTRTPNH